jgi:RHS repeat-associated protein
MQPYGNSTAELELYSGKEWQDEADMDWYDFEARNYSPELGRWMNPDPLVENFYAFSPYNYVFNNPLYFIDPNGMSPEGNWDGKTINLDEVVISNFDTNLIYQYRMHFGTHFIMTMVEMIFIGNSIANLCLSVRKVVAEVINPY